MIKIIKVIILIIAGLTIVAYFSTKHYFDKVKSDTHPQTVLTTLDYLETDKNFIKLRGEFKSYSFNHEKPSLLDTVDTVVINMKGSKNNLLINSFLKKEQDLWKIDNIEYSIVK